MKKRFFAIILTVMLLVNSLWSFCFAAQSDSLEQAISAAVQNCESSIDISSFNLKNTEQNRNIIHNYMLLDNPEFFHINHSSYNIVTTGENITAINGIMYTCTKPQYDALLLQLRQVATEIVNKVLPFDDQYTRALLLHDAIVLMCEYDTQDNAPYGHTAYGALVGKKAVCEGYANAYKYLLNMVGIKNELCQSVQLNHEWNVVYIDGVPYHVDVTFDDPVPNIYGRVLHDNFLVSTNTLKARHHNVNDISNQLPQDTRYDNADHLQITSAVIVNGSNQYYAKDGVIYQNSTAVKSVDAIWTVDNLAYTKKFVSVAFDGGFVYYNDNKSVYRINIANGETACVVTPAINDANIYGMHIVNGVVYMQFSKNYEDKIKSVESYKVSDIKPVKQLIDTSKVYSDIENTWYKQYVDYTYTNSIFKGNPDGTFKPLSNITRAEFVQVLANISGIDTQDKNITQKFADVKSGDWFAPAIMWAYNNGIVAGISESHFAPNEVITREQMCVMVVNYAKKYKGISFKVTESKENFVDDGAISWWAKEAVYICQQADIVNGKGEGSFDPQGTGRRAEATVIFTKFHKDYLA